MPRFLIGLASAHEALHAAPVARALLARGFDCRVAVIGDAGAADLASALGMNRLSIVPSGWPVAPDLEAASAFASTVLHDADPVILFGAGPAVTALATAARIAGRRTTQCDAGTRTGEPGDRDRRLADFSADHCFVRSVAERDQLVREGLSAELVQVVGALAAECFDQLVDDGSSGKAGGDVALALTADADGAYTAAARDLPLRWPGTPPEPLAELKRLRGAEVIITDDLAYQGLAAEMGVPCVVCAPARARNDLLERGAAFALDAACASGLYALAFACDALLDRRVDLALAGAVNHADDLFLHVIFDPQAVSYANEQGSGCRSGGHAFPASDSC